jgi:ASC-1-like (ASCH) protein
MSRQHHRLKTLTNYYQDVEKGKKNFEVRFNDRNFKVGDILYLEEFVPPSTYTGRQIIKEVVYILDDQDFCKEGYVIIGLKD